MLVFILLSFGISWLLWGLVALTGLNINENLIVGLAYVLGGFGPAIAGIFLAQRKVRSSLSHPSRGPSRMYEYTKCAPRKFRPAVLSTTK